MSEHKQPEYEKEETMKKNQIRKSVAAPAMAVVVGVSLLGYGCGSKSASTAVSYTHLTLPTNREV